MTVFLHELKQHKISLLIWSLVIAYMLGICIIIYPEMSSQMGDISEMFADMGSFSAAFGMDQLNFGDFLGYFSIECGNALGMGGAFFAALIGIAALAKEEKDHTAEFLLTHPISRMRIISEKLLSVFAQIVILNTVVILVSVAFTAIIGESIDTKTLVLLFLSYFLLQLEIAGITFGISAFLKNGGLGIGLGLAAVMYFLNIIANLTEEVEFLKHITPFGFADAAHIATNVAISGKYLLTNLALMLIGIILAYWKYNKKDIA